MVRGNILVSGASGGIGESAVGKLAEAGFVVYAGIIDESERSQVARIHQNIRPVLLDVTDTESLSHAIEYVNTDLAGSKLYGVWSNAGISRVAAFKNIQKDEIRNIVEVNLMGAMNFIHSAFPLLQRDQSRVVLTGSATGMFSEPAVSIYAASKWAFEGFVDALRIELKQVGIAVSLIQPGLIKTRMSEEVAASVDALLANMSQQAIEDFGVFVKKISNLSENASKSPDVVGKAVVDAFTSRKPRARYRVGIDAKAVTFICHLPDATKDFLTHRMYGV